MKALNILRQLIATFFAAIVGAVGILCVTLFMRAVIFERELAMQALVLLCALLLIYFSFKLIRWVLFSPRQLQPRIGPLPQPPAPRLAGSSFVPSASDPNPAASPKNTSKRWDED